MEPTQQELFDKALLSVLDANRTRFGLGLRAIGHQMAPFGFPAPKEDLVADRIDYLVRKDLVEEVTKNVHAANRAWRLTPAGFDFVDQHS